MIFKERFMKRKDNTIEENVSIYFLVCIKRPSIDDVGEGVVSRDTVF